MSPSQPSAKDSRWIFYSAYYLLLLSAITMLKVPFMLTEPETFPRDALFMPWPALLVAAGTLFAGVELAKFRRRGKILFLSLTPWLSFALASIYAPWLWQEDIPYTVLLIVPYLILVFFLSREQESKKLGFPPDETKSLLWLMGFSIALVLILGYFWIPQLTGNETLSERLLIHNEQTKWVVMRNTALLHYGGALFLMGLLYARKKFSRPAD